MLFSHPSSFFLFVPSFFFFFVNKAFRFVSVFLLAQHLLWQVEALGWYLVVTVESHPDWYLLLEGEKNKCFIKLKLALSNKTSARSVNDRRQQETTVLASPIEVTAVNGSYYGKILSRSFPFLFFSSRQLKKFLKGKKMYSVARVTCGFKTTVTKARYHISNYQIVNLTGILK